MRIILVLCLCTIAYAAFDKDKPASSTSLRDSNPEILANWDALETAIAQDHEFSTGGTNSGKHEVLTMEEESSAGASSTDELHVQAIDGGSGQPEFAITSEDGDELQMTKDGDLFSSDGLVVTENATFNGGITLGAGDDLIGSSTSDITFNTDKFTVAGATGNTVIDGTLDVNGTLDVTGNIDPTTYETTNGGFLDEDAMGSDAADKVASQQSIKAYAGMIPVQTAALTGYTGEESITFSNGAIIKKGSDASIAANATETITFAVAFTVAPVVVVGTVSNNTLLSGQCMANTITAASFKVTNSAETTVAYSWIAIGY